MSLAGSVSDEDAIRQLAVRYAQAIDRNEPEKLDELFAPDAVIEGPGFRMDGIGEIRGIPGRLKTLYSRTVHVVHQQAVTLSGETASCETHSTANHLTDQGEGAASNLVWSIRYQDRVRRQAGCWRFVHRQLIIDWTETRTVSTAGH
jgi:uncharacterized protein (TIGR02246 family)